MYDYICIYDYVYIYNRNLHKNRFEQNPTEKVCSFLLGLPIQTMGLVVHPQAPK